MKLIYTGDFDTLERLGFKKDTPLRYKKENLYIGANSKKIFLCSVDIVGDSLCVLFDLIEAKLVEKVEE